MEILAWAAFASAAVSFIEALFRPLARWRVILLTLAATLLFLVVAISGGHV